MRVCAVTQWWYGGGLNARVKVDAAKAGKVGEGIKVTSFSGDDNKEHVQDIASTS